MNYNYTFAFEKLSTWKESRELVKQVTLSLNSFLNENFLDLLVKCEEPLQALVQTYLKGPGGLLLKTKLTFTKWLTPATLNS